MPKLSDDVFPETLWKAFGEHMGEEEEEEEEGDEEEEDEEEQSKKRRRMRRRWTFHRDTS